MGNIYGKTAWYPAVREETEKPVRNTKPGTRVDFKSYKLLTLLESFLVYRGNGAESTNCPRGCDNVSE